MWFGNGEVRPEQSKLEAVENFPIPSTKKHIRAFLGLTGYHRRFIADYANIALLPTDLTKKDVPSKIQWTTACGNTLNRFPCCEALTSRSHSFSKQMLQTKVLGLCLAKLMQMVWITQWLKAATTQTVLLLARKLHIKTKWLSLPRYIHVCK